MPQRSTQKRYYRSRFSACVKVRPEVKRYLEESKDTKTVAGFLDKIINQHKKQYDEQRD